MARIDFYILAGSSPQNRERFACRLAEKAYKSGVPTFLRTENAHQSQRLDDLLWTFRPGSFVPHGLAPQATPTPVHIGEQAENDPRADTLVINLCQTPFSPSPTTARIAELVDDDPQQRQLARDRFRAYRAQGHEVNTHEVRADR
ncbi:MAG: DNA polymerase III subunit chi [Gammaproteobacteria bacterium]|nr:DNA polymerase III subunit chi [Gammaproteobacteria bacterium]